MKLYVQQVDGEDGVNCRAVRIDDDRGQKMPGVRAVNIQHRFNQPAWVIVEIIVNGRDVVFGSPPVAPAPSLRELITRAVPCPHQICEWETIGTHRADGTFEGGVRFTWRDARFTVDHNLEVAEVKGGMLGSTPIAAMLEALLKAKSHETVQN